MGNIRIRIASSTIIVLGIFVPLAASADDDMFASFGNFGSFFSGFYSESNANADTGGVTVSGEAVSTGNSNASAGVHSIISDDGTTRNVHVEIRTNSDGIEQREEIHKEVRSNELLSLEIGTSSADGSTKSSAHVFFFSKGSGYERPTSTFAWFSSLFSNATGTKAEDTEEDKATSFWSRLKASFHLLW